MWCIDKEWNFETRSRKPKTIDKLVEKSISSSTTIVSDGSSSHTHFKDLVDKHEIYVEHDVDKVVHNALPWIHIIIGECKSGIEAIHKEVDKRFLQIYLNEYCRKFNRRFFRDSSDLRFDLFDRLVRISAIYKSDIKWRDYSKLSGEDPELWFRELFTTQRKETTRFRVLCYFVLPMVENSDNFCKSPIFRLKMSIIHNHSCWSI